MKDASRPTWFHDESLDPFALVTLNPELTSEAFELTKGIRPKTTEITDRVLAKNFPGEEWASRPPAVLLGTTVTSDNYWKGRYHHQNALTVTEAYHCSDPFVSTEMEDNQIGKIYLPCLSRDPCPVWPGYFIARVCAQKAHLLNVLSTSQVFTQLT